MSTDQQQNLTILTEHILHLAEKQQQAIDQITGANRAIVDPAREVVATHGLVCGATNLAVEAIEAARRTAGGKFLQVSTEFVDKLQAASAEYSNTDSAAGGDLERCGV